MGEVIFEPFTLANPPEVDVPHVVRWLGEDGDKGFYDVAWFDGRKWRDVEGRFLSDITHCARITEPITARKEEL